MKPEDVALKQVYTDGTKLYRGVGWVYTEGQPTQLVYEEVTIYEYLVGVGSKIVGVKRIVGNQMYVDTLENFSRGMDIPTETILGEILAGNGKG